MRSLRQLRGWSRHAMFGLRSEWLALYLREPQDWPRSGGLGMRQVQSLRAWLRTTGLGVKQAAHRPYKDLAFTLSRDGLWPPGRSPLQVENRPNHPLAAMKEAVDVAFSREDGVSLNDLWRKLQGPPYGLMPSPIGVTLMGLLLREYSEGHYWRDGVNTRALNPTKLAALIDDVMHVRQVVSLYRITPEAREWCNLLREIFALPEQRTKYPESTRETLRGHLMKVGYPIWALEYVPTVGVTIELQAVGALHTILSETAEDSEVTNEELAATLPSLRLDERRLSHLVRENRFEDGMRSYFEEAEPALLAVAEVLHLSSRELMEKLKARLEEEVCLWQEEQVAGQLPELRAELELIHALNQLLRTQAKHLDTGLQHLRENLARNKLPLSVLSCGAEQDIADVLTALGAVLRSGREYVDKLVLADLLQSHLSRVRATLDDATGALTRWAQAELNEMITPDDAALPLESLSDLSYKSPGEVRRVVLAELSKLVRRRLARELAADWKETTASASPDAWSDEHLVPIDWVLDGPHFRKLLATLRNSDRRSTEELRRSCAIIRNQCGALRKLQERGPATRLSGIFPLAALYSSGARAEPCGSMEWVSNGPAYCVGC